MTEKPDDTVTVSHEEALAIAREWATAENMAALDAMSEAGLAEGTDEAPELTDYWFERARLVIPLKTKRAA